MNKEGENKIIIEKVEEIEEIINELANKLSLIETGMEILSSEMKKTVVSVLYYTTQGFSEYRLDLSFKYLQMSLSLLRMLEYYNYVSRKVGYFSSSPYLLLRDKIRDVERQILLSMRNLRQKGHKKKVNLPSLEEAEFMLRPSHRDPSI